MWRGWASVGIRIGNEFDDLPNLYESVFSDLDDQYLATGLLGERAFPLFPIQTRLGELSYHDSVVTKSVFVFMY